MRKIRLEIETLVVDSFAVDADAHRKDGTVFGNGATYEDTCYVGSCYPATCAGQDFCQYSYDTTCITVAVTQCFTGAPWENTCADPACMTTHTTDNPTGGYTCWETCVTS
jgi:hypothetical protein